MVETRQGSLNILAHEYMFWLRRLVIHRLEVVTHGTDVPLGGAIVVANHPNGLIDGAIILETSPRLTAVLSKKPLFSTPIVGQILRAMNAKPVVRKQDAVSGDNTQLFAEVHAHLNQGGAITVFPEGISHDEARVMPLKTGAARMALEGNARWIIPGGIYYEEKGVIRSDALVRYGAPLAVLPTDTVTSLTERIHVALEQVVITCGDRAVYNAVTKAANVAFDCTLSARVAAIEGLLRYAQGLDADEKNAFLGRVRAISELGWRVCDRPSVKELTILTLLASPGTVGWLTSKPIELLISWLAKRQSTDPDLLPSIKILGANIFYPILWFLGTISLGIGVNLAAGALFLLCWPSVLWARLIVVGPLRRCIGWLKRIRPTNNTVNWREEFDWLRSVSEGDDTTGTMDN